MATRNRTTVYRKHRDACKSARAPLSASYSFGGPVIEMVSGSFARSNHSSYAPLSSNDPGPSSDAFTIGLPPAWVDDSEEINFNIQKVREKMGELAKAHSKALMPTFGDNKGNQRAVEMLTHDITDLLRNSEKKLHKLSTRGSSEESNLRKNVQRSLATDLQNLSMELRRKQSTYLKRLQQQKEVALGDMNELLNSDYNADKLPPGKLSTKGVGRTAPNPSEAKTLEDGVVVPLGKPVDHSSSKGTLLYNEYIVYNTEQIKMRYVIQVKFNYKY